MHVCAFRRFPRPRPFFFGFPGTFGDFDRFAVLFDAGSRHGDYCIAGHSSKCGMRVTVLRNRAIRKGHTRARWLMTRVRVFPFRIMSRCRRVRWLGGCSSRYVSRPVRRASLEDVSTPATARPTENGEQSDRESLTSRPGRRRRSGSTRRPPPPPQSRSRSGTPVVARAVPHVQARAVGARRGRVSWEEWQGAAVVAEALMAMALEFVRECRK